MNNPDNAYEQVPELCAWLQHQAWDKQVQEV